MRIRSAYFRIFQPNRVWVKNKNAYDRPGPSSLIKSLKRLEHLDVVILRASMNPEDIRTTKIVVCT